MKNEAMLVFYKNGKQSGSALLVALIFLGVLTMLGISVALTSTTQLKISANSEETNRTFHSTNAGANLLLTETVLGENRSGDILLHAKSQSGKEQDLSSSFAGNVYSNVTTDKKYDRALTVSIKQTAKGTTCPRSEKASSTTKVACDFFDISSTYQHEINPDYKPSVKVGIYREMVYVNSATAKAVSIPGI